MKDAAKEATFVQDVLRETRQRVNARILAFVKDLEELDEALGDVSPQNPMEDASYRENLAEGRIKLQENLSRKEALLRHIKRMPVSCGASRVTSESVVLTEDKNVLIIVSEADGESFLFQGYRVNLMSPQAPLFQQIRNLHEEDVISWKNGETTTIIGVY